MSDELKAAPLASGPTPDETEQRIASIETRLSARTRPEWYADYTCTEDLAVRYEGDEDDPNVGRIIAIIPPAHEKADASWEDAELIANAPDDLRFLLDQLAAARSKLREAAIKLDVPEGDVPDEIDGLLAVANDRAQSITMLESLLREAERDRERLTWLDRDCFKMSVSVGVFTDGRLGLERGHVVDAKWTHKGVGYPSLRAAIDAARAALPPETPAETPGDPNG